MPGNDAFIDSNVILYLLSSDDVKADNAEAVLGSGGVISVQVLNEAANVARRKLSMTWREVGDWLGLVRSLCQVELVTLESHECGCRLAERYSLSVFDAMIVGSALIAGCSILYTEDMQDGLIVEDQLRIVNPFGN